MHEHITPSVHDLAARAAAAQLSEKAQERLAWIVHFLTHDHSITDTCLEFGISRSTFCRWLERFNPDDLTSLEERSHEPQTLRQSAVSAEVTEMIRAYRKASPLLGKERIAEMLKAEHGVDLSPSTVGRVIERECLYFADTPLHWKKRMRLTLRGAKNGDAPTELTAMMPEPEEETRTMPRLNWKMLKESLMWATIVTNLAVIALLAFSALWESKVATQRYDASVLQSQQPLSSDAPRE